MVVVFLWDALNCLQAFCTCYVNKHTRYQISFSKFMISGNSCARLSQTVYARTNALYLPTPENTFC